MTDRELLELAAKAAGIGVIRSRLDDPACKDFLVDEESKDGQRYSGWNPLSDDGDALRLAVKLQLDIYCCAVNTVGGTRVLCNQLDDTFSGDKTDDPMQATRRAIVRAAAEIGKTK